MLPFFELFLLTAALSVDAFAVSFAYGVAKIKLPPVSVLIVTLCSSLTLVLSLFAGSFFSRRIPEGFTNEISFLILFFLGIFKLFQKTSQDCGQADKNHDSRLSAPEALTLGFGLSIDSIAAGIGAGVMEFRPFAAFFLSLAVGALAVRLGFVLGRLASQKFHRDLLWVGGLMLVFLSFLKLFP